MDSLSGITAFASAAEKGSFAGAGRVLGVSASAVAKSVARLEAKIGVRLLERTTRKARLTEAGTIFHERCRRILDELADAEASLAYAREAPRGSLRVSLPHVMAETLVLPRLASFVEKFPDVELEINLEDQLTDIIADGIDVAVRTGELGDSRFISRRLGPQRFIVCATPAYFARHGTPRNPRDLAAHRCLHFKFPTSGRLQPWSFREEFADLTLGGGLIFNNSNGIIGAALADLGIGQVPVYAVRHHIAEGLLVSVLDEYMVPRGSLWLIWPSNRHLSPKVRVFADFVVECLKSGPGLDGAEA